MAMQLTSDVKYIVHVACLYVLSLFESHVDLNLLLCLYGIFTDRFAEWVGTGSASVGECR